MPRVPENSQSRAALEAAAHLLALVESSSGAADALDGYEALRHVVGVLRNVKGLRDYQLDELVDFVAIRLTGSAYHFLPDQHDPDVDGSDERQERHRAAVDDLIGAGQTTIDDIEDPKAAADELAARVRGTVFAPEPSDEAPDA